MHYALRLSAVYIKHCAVPPEYLRHNAEYKEVNYEKESFQLVVINHCSDGLF